VAAVLLLDLAGVEVDVTLAPFTTDARV